MADLSGSPTRRLQAIHESFDPWHSDPTRISRLFLWLTIMEEAPKGTQEIAAFIRDPTPFAQQYHDMCEWEV